MLFGLYGFMVYMASELQLCSKRADTLFRQAAQHSLGAIYHFHSYNYVDIDYINFKIYQTGLCFSQGLQSQEFRE